VWFGSNIFFLLRHKRDVFEEAVNSVVTVRDFSHIWEAYTTFEDSLVAAKMDMLGDQETLEDENLDVDLEEETAGIFLSFLPLSLLVLSFS
jgi:hypothetical protein